MYRFVFTLQCVTIAVVFAECWVVFRNLKNRLHSYLFLSCVATLVNSIGYAFMLVAKTEDVYYQALMTSWLGRVWITFSLFLFIVELCRFKVIMPVRILLGFINVCTLIAIYTTRTTGLFYRNISFSMKEDFPCFDYENGPWHIFWGLLLAGYIIVTMIILFRALKKEKSPVGKKRMQTVILAILSESVIVIIYMFELIPLAKVYDLTMIGFPIGAVLTFVAIFKYNLLDIEAIARDYVVDELSAGVIAVDSDEKPVFYNKTANKIFPGLTADPGAVINDIKRSMTEDQPLSIEGRLYSPETKPVMRDGYDEGSIYVLVDSTSHYRHIRELEEQKQIASDANEAKSRFLASMSHEIRTPINSVLGMDEMILRESSEKEILSYARDIQTSGRTLLSLINDILDFSKIEEGRMEILPVEYEPASVINDMVNMIKGRAEAKGLKFEVEVDEKVPDLLIGDEIWIKQIILNLLTNAVKYTHRGSVRFEVSYEKKSEDSIMLGVKISDTGIGMKSEDMEKLFAPYERIEEVRNRSVEGTGLGMSIVKNLLDMMGSSLQVKSVYGEGSEFFFEISQQVVSWEPLGNLAERLEKRLAESGEYHELFHAPDARILIVDDTPVNLTVMEKLLGKTRIGIDTAMSGRQAIRLMEDKSYDVVFIDHMMPEMDGIETLHRMKDMGDDQKKGIYIILTANAVSGAREMFLNEGFNDYLSKPIDSRLLEEMLKKYLPPSKVLDPKEDVVENKAADEEKDDLAWLNDVEGLDVKSGIEYCESKDIFMAVLVAFYDSAKDNADEIERYYDNKDIKNYTVKLHALKSSAAVIGAKELSEHARELEIAGKEENLEKINRETGQLLKEYRKLYQDLALLDLTVGV